MFLYLAFIFSQKSATSLFSFIFIFVGDFISFLSTILQFDLLIPPLFQHDDRAYAPSNDSYTIKSSGGGGRRRQDNWGSARDNKPWGGRDRDLNSDWGASSRDNSNRNWNSSTRDNSNNWGGGGRRDGERNTSFNSARVGGGMWTNNRTNRNERMDSQTTDRSGINDNKWKRDMFVAE